MIGLERVFPGAEMRRRPSSYATSHVTEEVEIVRSGGRRLSLLLKHLGPGSLIPEARDTKPDFLHDPTRELYVYRHLLPALDLGTARLYATRRPAGDRSGWLLLERVSGVELWQIGDMASWKRVARWLATFHRRSAPLVTACGGAPLLRYDRDFLARWPGRAAAFHAERPARERAALARLSRSWQPLVERLSSIPKTILHGDFYPSNVLVDGPRVCPVDWELAAIGPGVVDLAALVSGFEAAERLSLVCAYHDAAGARRWWGGSEELGAAVDDARLYLCLQWLGWAPGWKPPTEHARNWLAEAIELEEERSW
jgi:aminoglycoside phosphotransferase (APT) family kinase protein